MTVQSKQLLTIAEAAAEIGSRTRTYDLIGAGKLRAVKLGKSTRVVAESLRQFIDGLPEARIAPPRRRANAL